MNKIKAYFKDEMNLELDSLIKISGDASSRAYYKAVSKNQKYVVCTESANSQQSTDFVLMSKFLSKDIRTPQIILSDLNESIIIQEDIGDETLNYYLAKNTAARESMIIKAVKEIEKYQNIPKHDFEKQFKQYFDTEKVSFEINLAIANFIEKFHDYKVSKENQVVLDKFKKVIIEHFENHKDVVCHRDYHGRNLHVKEDELIHIDFQDARIGPREYDLVSLIEDSYFRLDPKIKERLKELFFENNRSYYANYEEFNSKFRIVAIQRIFKALGSFCYLKFEKNKEDYEKYISNAMENLRHYLEEDERFSEFRLLVVEIYYGN